MAEQKLFSIEHDVNYYECDPSGRISLSTLIALMILASEKHNEAMGVDESVTMKLGGSWVILDYEAHFNAELPQQNDHIILQTQLVAYNKYFAVRRFIVRDSLKNLIGTVNGLFVYMNLAKRKISTIPHEIMEPYKLGITAHLPNVHRPDRIKLSDEWTVFKYRVRYFDIDFNGHVNNARYFDWMLDTLDHHFLLDHQVVNFRMNYEHEVRPGTIVASYSSNPVENDEHYLVTQHKVLVGTDECASATITWR